jgi:Tfp pilus assembly protein PilW
MIGTLRRRLSVHDSQAGLTLMELLVAAAMSVVVVGAAGSMLISAVRTQPQVSKRAQNITTARYQLDRMTHEIRNGIRVDPTMKTATRVSFVARVRRTACGGPVPTGSTPGTIKCQITYTCATTSCTRVEANEGVYSNAAATSTIITGIDSSSVFCYVPSTDPDPTVCGPAATASPTYIGITLRVPNPSGPSALTISDGASLRAATLSY